MNEAVTIRAGIVEFLRKELVGPDPRPEHASINNGDEILRPQDPPRMRFSAGVLFPGGTRVADVDAASPEEVEAADSGPPEGDEPEEGQTRSTGVDLEPSTEHEVNRANQYLPSAMGMSAMIRMPKALKVLIKAGRYERQAVINLGKPDKDGKWQPHHLRRAVSPERLHIDCAPFLAVRHVTRELPIETGVPDLRLALHVYSRPYSRALNPTLDRIVTFTLINRTVKSSDSPKDHECLFQCEFSVEDAAGARPFLEYPERDGLPDDDEEASLRLLYRMRKTFAVGHGCAAEWPEAESESDSASWIRTNSLPTYEIKPILPREIDGVSLSMRTLANPSDASGLLACDGLADAYQNWINEQRTAVESPAFPERHRTTARRHLQLCVDCHARIVDGISLLKQDSDSRRAFAWMNQAMLLQQLHYDLASNHRRTWARSGSTLALEKPYKAPDSDNPPAGKGQWRPFQLAFVLMNLRSIAQRDHPDRSVVDLIWFPTGGGKTEAYLALTAFTLFRRRLFDPGDGGTAVLMRYTLRLLTTQQFQRAASLIAACEILRRQNEAALGPTRYSIGLWVGQSVTPNKNSIALSDLNKLLQNGKPNPFIVLACPWCGAEMGPVAVQNAYQAKGYRKERGTVVFRCEDPDCDFRDSRGLPLLVIDEAIYAERPSLVIGTVDKFAMLPWYPDSRRIFGLDSEAPASPPDLIIQDELHLISGALGSMVGMYEGTIDALCTRAGGLGAKIVASTATICQAPKQVRALYARDVALFPPQGLRAGDSFFAEERAVSRDGQPVPGRMYVGVFASALSSHVTAQVRVMSALLQAAKSVPASGPAAIDPYWTLMAYFNSLRELGHAATLVRADIREHLNAMWDRLGIRKPEAGSGAPDERRFINRDLELTSRIQSEAITDALQQLFNQSPASDDRRPVDVCLATNMIQVGLDVPRLGLMTVVGQPKTTAEYIQATSRVGRDARGPGLVVAVLNPGKPRDRSHFEHFRSYHQSIYRWVEPTSVTPFAVPVRERALHAQVVTLSRFWGNALLRERPTPAPDDSLFERIWGVIVSRVDAVDQSEATLTAQTVRDIGTRWRNIQPPIYGHFGPPPQETPLMYPAGSEPRAIWANRSKATPSSMRNVDSGCDAEVILQYPQP